MMIPKFRAWDKETEQYFKVLAIDFESKIVSCRYFEWKNGPSNPINLDDLALEQFTGLKDVNGKDIYEGDIVKYTAEDGDSFLAPVKYFAADGYPAFDIPTAFIPYWHFESNVLSAGMAENSIEVVGNIHDSPELLEAQHDTQPD